MFIPEDLRTNPCVTAHSKELKLGFSEIFEKGTKSPLQKAGATQPRNTKKPPGWEALSAILYEDEYTSSYLSFNEFIFVGESMVYGY